MNVEFKYVRKRKVNTVFGRIGIITARSFNPDEVPEAQILYYVKTDTAESSGWVNEDEIIPDLVD